MVKTKDERIEEFIRKLDIKMDQKKIRELKDNLLNSVLAEKKGRNLEENVFSEVPDPVFEIPVIGGPNIPYFTIGKPKGYDPFFWIGPLDRNPYPYRRL